MIEDNTALTHVVRHYSLDGYGNPKAGQRFDTQRTGLLAWEASSLSSDLTGVEDNQTATLYLKKSVEVSETDIFIIQGREYKIVGSIERWNAPANFSIQTYTRFKIALMDGVVDS